VANPTGDKLDDVTDLLWLLHRVLQVADNQPWEVNGVLGSAKRVYVGKVWLDTASKLLLKHEYRPWKEIGDA